MYIAGLKINIVTEYGVFGFEENFSRHLTIVRAQNSSGKSTLFNTILYALGCEEILGGKGEGFLSYCLTSNFEYKQKTIKVLSSEVFLEVENKYGEVKTFRRAIKDNIKNSKLVEIYNSKYITEKERLGVAVPTYLHDAGAAINESGFHSFLENFLDLNLPQVPNTSGSLTKLYIQTIFAAHAVEQKRGWTDYIANIPFFGIRDVKTRVIEYLLGLEVFDINELKNFYISESNKIISQWDAEVKELSGKVKERNGFVKGLPTKPSNLFHVDEIEILLQDELTISQRISILDKEYLEAKRNEDSENNVSSVELVDQIENIEDELNLLIIKFDHINNSLNRNKITISDYNEILEQIENDLIKNKSAFRLRQLGAEYDIQIANDKCPTCFQNVVDNLFAETIKGPQMDLKEQIEYLNSQKKMLQNQIIGLNANNEVIELSLSNVKKEIQRKNEVIRSIKKSITSGSEISKLYVRQQIYIENEVRELQSLKDVEEKVKTNLNGLLIDFIKNQSSLNALPKDVYSVKDKEKIKCFEKKFKENADDFGYKSASISDIHINFDNLIPTLNHLELREIRKSSTKIDSSASDFVRLIWSFLLGLQQTGLQYDSNILNILLLDEPGQHSMALNSQRMLFKKLAETQNLQSIVAASFDNDEGNFNQVTSGLNFKLISWDEKLIKPLR